MHFICKAAAVRHWTPIGNASNNYKGRFNGNNHTVSGLYFNKNQTDYVGLFGYVSDYSCHIENTGVIDSYFSGSYYVGGVVGYKNGGTIENCYNTSTVAGYNSIGGIAGYNRGSIINCYNEGAINGEFHTGGIVGTSATSEVIDCYNTGAINAYRGVGGTVGNNAYSASITNCYSTGTVKGYEYVGLLVGYND